MATFTQSNETIYTFPESAAPSSLLQAQDGNFYGVLNSTIFEVTASGGFSTLYTFSASDGVNELNPALLTEGVDRNLYGTTPQGDASASASSVGAGSIFKLTLQGTYSVLYSFSGPDGACTFGCGTVFKLTPAGSLTTVSSSRSSLMGTSSSP